MDCSLCVYLSEMGKKEVQQPEDLQRGMSNGLS